LLRSWDFKDLLRSWVFNLDETSAGETLRLLDVILLMKLAILSVYKVLCIRLISAVFLRSNSLALLIKFC